MMSERVIHNPIALNMGVLVVCCCNLALASWLVLRYPLLSYSFCCVFVSLVCWIATVSRVINTGLRVWLGRDVLISVVAGYLAMCAGVALAGVG